MSVNLQKGQKVDLTKGNSSLNKIIVGLGWDEKKKESGKGLFGALFSGGGTTQNIDCDASAIMCKNGKVSNEKDLIYYGNLQHKSKSVIHMGDNLTGAGDGDDEQITVELSKVPEEYDRVVIVVNIYDVLKRKQHFGMIENAFIRIVDSRTNTELCKYNLSENYDDMYAMVFGELYRHNNEWKFNAIGEATKDAGIGELINRFR